MRTAGMHNHSTIFSFQTRFDREALERESTRSTHQVFEIYALGAEVALGIHGERDARNEAGEGAYLQSGI